MSSGLPSLARAMATAARRTSGCCALSAWEQRAIVRRASSGLITPSCSIHSTSERQSMGPRGAVRAEALSFVAAVMEGSRDLLEDAQPFARRQGPASFDGFGAAG